MDVLPEARMEDVMHEPLHTRRRGPNLFPGGNWIGHVFPGTLFIVWASHWLLGFVRHYFECIRHRIPYRSKACYRCVHISLFLLHMIPRQCLQALQSAGEVASRGQRKIWYALPQHSPRTLAGAPGRI